jgi:carbamoyltransferase
VFILGISAFYHDSAACIIDSEKVLAAVQEERFTRIKHDNRFPIKSIEFCLRHAGININQIDKVVFYEKPFLKFERILETHLAFSPFGLKSFITSMPIWLKEKLFQKNLIISFFKKNFQVSNDFKKKLLFSEHHLSHAASAFFPSPFKESAILTFDGVGEWTTSSLSFGKNNKIDLLKEIRFPHSLGLLYSAFTYYTGFRVNSGEYKLMGLAPYGNPKYTQLIKDELIDIKNDGSFKLNMSYFNYCVGLTMTNKKFNKLFNGPRRSSESKITQKEMDIAASIQKVTEEVIIKTATFLKKETNSENLCLSGGVALNCVANGKLQNKNIFKNIWIQPASGDAGGALGAALSIKYLYYDKKRETISNDDIMQGAYLGPEFNEKQILDILNEENAVFEKLTSQEIIKQTAKLLSEGKAVGWMNGRMEFGPRSLGNRSILADPRSDKMQKQLNLKIKYRESFRPFAPSVLYEDINEWFDMSVESPYMLMTSNVKKNKLLELSDDTNTFGIEKLNQPRSIIPAVTHVDNSARIQTVHKKTNSDFFSLLSEFKKITGCPILVNTSFNIRGEPIVCSPKDAYRCFMGTQLDVLVIENFILKKENQKNKINKNYQSQYDLD